MTVKDVKHFNSLTWNGNNFPAEEKRHLNLEEITSNLLKHSGEGLFFLNHDLEVQQYYSVKLEEILGVRELANNTFITLLENRVPEETIKQTHEYLEILFREDLDEATVSELNPLVETEFFYEDEWGLWSSSRYLSFRFKRIYESNAIKALIGIVKDISKTIHLARQLTESEDHTQQQMEWLVNILHVEPHMLKDFFMGVEKELNNIEQVLKNAKGTKKPFEILENIYRALYIIKGNATLLNLNFFANIAERFINKILEIKSKQQVGGSDFVPIVIQLGDLRTTLEDVKTIFKRISHFHNHFRAKRSYESELLVNSLKELIRNLSNQLGKHVFFDYRDFDALSIPYVSRQLVREVLFLLIRNTILYAIESTDERKSSNKNEIATLKISSFISKNTLGLVLRHDGRIERIERLLQRMLNAENLDSAQQEWEGTQATQLLIMPNILMNSENEILSNYSMDMELLKKKLQEKGGRLKITFTSEQNCEFTVLLPLGN